MRQEKTWVATFDEASCRVFSFNGNPRRLVELEEERRAGERKPHFADRAGRVHAAVGGSAGAAWRHAPIRSADWKPPL